MRHASSFILFITMKFKTIRRFLLIGASCLITTMAISQVTAKKDQQGSFTNFVKKTDGGTTAVTQLKKVVDDMFVSYAQKNNLPGVAYAVVYNGKLLYTGSFGYTDIDKKVAVTPHSLFRIASMSKSFTAMAIQKLRQEGKLQLDDPVVKYLPIFATVNYPGKSTNPVTIRHLLTHKAGFPEDNPWGDRQLQDSDAELEAFIKKGISFSNAPGIAYEYSNLGFALLGKIITVVSGEPYQQYIRKNIWQPLGMNTAVWEYAEVPENKLAQGYRWRNAQWENEALLHDVPDGSWGAMGSMICSVNEFAAYMNAHLDAAVDYYNTGNKPVNSNLIREMQQPWSFAGFSPQNRYADGRLCATVNGYGYGLRISRDCDSRVFVGHSGGLPGFGSNWNIMPDFGLGIVSVANRTYAPMTAMNIRVLDTLVQLAGLTPLQLQPSAILQQRQQQLTAMLPGWDGAAASGIFAENFFPDYPVADLKKQTMTLFAKIGAVKNITPVIPMNQLRGNYIIEGEKGKLRVFFTLSPENPALIQHFEIREVTEKK